MSTIEDTETTRSRISQQTIAKQFVRLYYGILNRHHEYLYQFYGKNSTVTVSETLEGGETAVEAAEEETAVKELLSTLYSDVSIRVSSAVPQFSIDDSVLIHVNGVMERKSTESRRAFTQVFVLFPQENGYYIRTDVAHVMGPGSGNLHYDHHFNPCPNVWKYNEDGKQAGDQETPSIGASNSEYGMVLRLGSYEGDIPDEEHYKRSELRTSTPPVEDARRTQAKSQASDQESDDNGSQTAQSQRKVQPWIVRPPGTSSSICHSVMAQPVTMHPMQTAMAMPPLPIGHASMNGVMYPIAMSAAPVNSRYLRQRSASMGCDPWAAQRASGHGVFIARLPFGIQPADVEQAFATFGPIQGGREGIQVRDGRNGCYAFVTFENPESAQIAIQQGAVIQGKRVFVEPRYPRQEPEAHFLTFPTMIPSGPLAPPPPPYHMTQASKHVSRMLK